MGADETAPQNEGMAALAARVLELEEALRPFAAAVAFVAPSMADGQEIAVSFARKDTNQQPWETTDAIPTVASVGDIRRAARLLGLPERT